MYQNRSFKKQSVSMNNAKERKRLEKVLGNHSQG